MRKLTTSEIDDEERNPGYTRTYKVLAKFQVAAADKGEVKSILERFAQEQGGLELVEMQVDEIRPSRVRRLNAPSDKTLLKGKKFNRLHPGFKYTEEKHEASRYLFGETKKIKNH